MIWRKLWDESPGRIVSARFLCHSEGTARRIFFRSFAMLRMTWFVGEGRPSRSFPGLSFQMVLLC